MDLFHIQHQLIANRTSEAWYRIRPAGPDFNYRWSYGWSADDDFSNIIGEHHSRAVCREEPSLTVSWGMDVHDREDRVDLQFGWAGKLGDPKVRAIWADFFWNGALIDRVELLRVDGTHGVIPWPISSDEGLEVSAFEAAVAHLIHDLESGEHYDNPTRYLNTIGASVVRDAARHGSGSH